MKAGSYRGRVLAAVLVLSAAAWTGLQRLGHARGTEETPAGADAAWAHLEAIPAESVVSYQLYWACAAHVLDALSRRAECRSAAERAIGLSRDSAVRDFLVDRFTRR